MTSSSSKSKSKSKKKMSMEAKISVVPLTHVPPFLGKAGEMSLREKKEFYSLPVDVQKWYKQQFNPLLGEPDTLSKQEMQELWLANIPCELVPNAEEIQRKQYGGEFEDSIFGPDDKVAWNAYLNELSQQTRTYILSIMNQKLEEEDSDICIIEDEENIGIIEDEESDIYISEDDE